MLKTINIESDLENVMGFYLKFLRILNVFKA